MNLISVKYIIHSFVFDVRSDQSNMFNCSNFRPHITKYGLIYFLCQFPVSSCFSFSPSLPLDSLMTSEQIEQNINCLPNLCKCMLIYTCIDSQWARYLDHLERPGRDSVCVTLKVASSIPNELSLGALVSLFDPQ